MPPPVEHESPGEATVYLLHGRVRLGAGDLGWEGSPGGLLVVPDARRSLQALEDSAVLLTVRSASAEDRSRRLPRSGLDVSVRTPTWGYGRRIDVRGCPWHGDDHDVGFAAVLAPA